MLISLYRKHIPKTFRDKIYNLFLSDILFFYRNFKPIVKSKIIYVLYPFMGKSELNKAWHFMGKHGITSYPFKTSINYNASTYLVQYDETYKLKYIMHNNRKLFFPKHFEENKIRELYTSLIIEQDYFSPHKYVEDISLLKDRTLVDIGSAEGIFSLDTIEYTKEVYLFECEDYWIEALNATFAPWREKVQIIKKYISDTNSIASITLDSFFSKKTTFPLFLKMDIEGAEQSALNGARNMLQKNQDVFLSVCTYHNKNDAYEINVFFKNIGYKTELTEGYLYWEKGLRRAVLRANNKRQKDNGK